MLSAVETLFCVAAWTGYLRRTLEPWSPWPAPLRSGGHGRDTGRVGSCPESASCLATTGTFLSFPEPEQRQLERDSRWPPPERPCDMKGLIVRPLPGPGFRLATWCWSPLPCGPWSPLFTMRLTPRVVGPAHEAIDVTALCKLQGPCEGWPCLFFLKSFEREREN